MKVFDTGNIIQKIIDSNTFSNKEVLKGLLKFLHTAYQKDLILKEFDIAQDYFKRDESFISGDDTIVRVNIHKLRLLLTQYNMQEGKHDPVKVDIPKGSYTLHFNDKKDNNINNTKKLFFGPVIIIVLIISFIFNIILLINPINKYSNFTHPVWKDYLNSFKPVSIILGDPFFYTSELSDSIYEIHRKLDINSMNDLHLKYFNKYKGLNYPYFSKNNVIALPNIISILSESKKDIQIQALSELNIDNTKNSNQIFIANINSFRFYNQYLEKSSVRIETNPRKLMILDDNDTINYTVPENVEGYYFDYAFLVKVPGPNNNIISLIGDFHASGNKGLSNLLNDKEKLQKLENNIIKKYNEFPKYFEMVVKVSSFHYSDLKTEIIYFNKLNFTDSINLYIPEMMN